MMKLLRISFLRVLTGSVYFVSSSWTLAADSEAAVAAKAERARLQAENKMACALEQVRAHLEEWGSVTISEPLLLPVGEEFDLGKEETFPNASAYIAANRTGLSAASAQFNQSVLVAKGGLSLALPAADAIGPAGGAAGGTPAPVPKDPPPLELPTAQAKDFLAKSTFEAPNTLVPDLTGISERHAVHSGLGDKLNEKATRLLANPSKLKDGNKRYFAVFQVTCNPGWRTTQNYMADVQLQLEYGRYAPVAKGGAELLHFSLSDRNQVQPLIIAALPLSDAQNMELRNSQRELKALSAALAAAGPTSIGNASGKALLDYIRSYQSDASSRHAMPVVNSYSTGTLMGFRFSPSFMALGDPAKKKSKSVNRLIPTSFPVVLLIEFKPEDYGPYTHLVAHYSQRWLLRDRAFSLIPWHWPKRRETESRRIELVRDVEDARAELDRVYDASGSEPMSQSPAFLALRRDFFELQQKALLRSTVNKLPTVLTNPPGATPAPSSLEIFPKMINPGLESAIVIKGAHVGDGLKGVTIGGRACDVLQSTSGAVMVRVSAGPLVADEQGNADVVIFTETGTNTDAKIKVLPSNDGERAFVIQRDDQGRIKRLEFPEEGTLKNDKLIDAATTILAPAPTKKE